MEIHNHGNHPRVHFSSKSNHQAGNVEEGQSVERASETKPQSLVDRLEGDQKVRDRLLVEIKAKVQAGEYATRAAAEQAAQHIVD